MNRSSSEKDRDFLRAIEKLGGEAIISEIKEVADLSTNEANGRFRKFENDNLIEVNHEEYNPHQFRKIAILTDKGYSEIAKGDFGDPTETPEILSHNDQIEELKSAVESQNEKIQELKNRQLAIFRAIDERIKDEGFVDCVKSYISELEDINIDR